MWVFELNFLLFTRDSVAASIHAKGLGVNLSLNHSSFFYFIFFCDCNQNFLRHHIIVRQTRLVGSE